MLDVPRWVQVDDHRAGAMGCDLSEALYHIFCVETVFLSESLIN